MGLYLCVFDGDEEIEGVDVGAYADFNAFREYILNNLEEGRYGKRFPTLMLHKDSDGEWRVEDCEALEAELDAIARELETLPPLTFPPGWQAESARVAGLVPTSARDSFVDVDGEPLVDRLRQLARIARKVSAPILFQ